MALSRAAPRCTPLRQAAAGHWSRSQRRERGAAASGRAWGHKGRFRGLRFRGGSAQMPFACPIRRPVYGRPPARTAHRWSGDCQSVHLMGGLQCLRHQALLRENAENGPPGALRPASSPWRAARSSPADVTGLSNGGAGQKRAFGMPIRRIDEGCRHFPALLDDNIREQCTPNKWSNNRVRVTLKPGVVRVLLLLR